jgi:hypothetical protein
MKYFFYLFIVLVCIGSVYAIDYPIGKITNCDSPITLSVTAIYPIDFGEFSINCPYDDVWTCQCGSNMIISVLPNTVNIYTIKASYTTTTVSSGGSHHSGGSYTPITWIVSKNATNTSKNMTLDITVPIGNVTPNITPPPVITPPVITPPVITPNDTNITGIVTPETKIGFFGRLWDWIKKILFYKIGGEKNG